MIALANAEARSESCYSISVSCLHQCLQNKPTSVWHSRTCSAAAGRAGLCTAMAVGCTQQIKPRLVKWTEPSPSLLAVPVVNSSPECRRDHAGQPMQAARDPFGMVLYMTLSMVSLSLAGRVTLSPCCKDGNEAGHKVTQKSFWISGNWTAFQSPSTLRSFAPIPLFSCSHRTTSHLKLNKCMKIARTESGKRMRKLREKIKNTGIRRVE